ncbi:MAG: preprotein translocase subunit SecG [Patescibacteria group bacterium]
MGILLSYLPLIQVFLSVALIVLVLLQREEAGLGGAFGDATGGGTGRTRRGLELTLFYATIVTAILFVSVTVARLFL